MNLTADSPVVCDLALVLLVLLELNGYHVNATNEEFADIIMGIASSEKDDNDLTEWLETHCVPGNMKI